MGAGADVPGVRRAAGDLGSNLWLRAACIGDGMAPLAYGLRQAPGAWVFFFAFLTFS